LKLIEKPIKNGVKRLKNLQKKKLKYKFESSLNFLFWFFDNLNISFSLTKYQKIHNISIYKIIDYEYIKLAI